MTPLHHASHHHPSPSPQRGAALISVILLLGLLTVLITSLSVYVTNSATAITLERERVLRDVLTQSALEFGVGRVLSTPAGLAIRGEDKIRLQTGRATLKWRAETARLDLNFADPNFLASLFMRAGLNEEQAKNLARTIAAKRTLNASQPLPKEFSILQGRKLGPFEHSRELLGIPGLTPELFIQIEPFVTVYGVSAALDPRLADRTLLEAIPNISAPILAELTSLSDLSDTDAKAKISDLGDLARQFDFTRHMTVRFVIQTETSQGGKHQDEIVIVHYADDSRPYRVLSWHQLD